MYTDDQSYSINGCSFVVTPVFRHHGNINDDPTLDKCVKRMLESDVVPLLIAENDDTMTAENVCSAAGKEDNYAVEEEN
jgi:phage-related protein